MPTTVSARRFIKRSSLIRRLRLTRKRFRLSRNAETHNNLGKVYYRAKRNQEAVASFKAAIALRPNFAEAHFNLAVAYVALGDKKGVLEEYKTLKTIDPALQRNLLATFLKRN